MSYNFLPYEPDQMFLLPPSLAEWVREESLARFVSEVVDELEVSGGDWPRSMRAIGRMAGDGRRTRRR